MDTAIITLTATAAIIVVAFVMLSLCRSGASGEDAEPVVGVQRHGRTFLVPRRHIDSLDRLDDERVAAGLWRALTLAVLGSALLIGALARLS